MKPRIYYAQLAAPVFLFGGTAVVGEDHATALAGEYNTISINAPSKCITFDGTMSVEATDGRVFVKFDTKPWIATVTGKCNITGLPDNALEEDVAEGFP